jgi:hypothetical protein
LEVTKRQPGDTRWLAEGLAKVRRQHEQEEQQCHDVIGEFNRDLSHW